MKTIFLIFYFVLNVLSFYDNCSLYLSTTNDCFTFVTEFTYFFEADEFCATLAHGAHLASVGDAFANAAIQMQAKSLFDQVQDQKFWLGGSTMYTPGNWSWTDGVNFGYSNWAAGNPLPNNDTLCLSENIKDGKWYSESCFAQKPYVCKFPGPIPVTNITTTTKNPKDNCQNGWAYFDLTNRCFQVIHGVNFSQAFLNCQSLNSSFVSIHNDEENDFLTTLCQNNDNDGFCRIGLHDLSDTRKLNFTWMDGSQLNYTNWSLGNPNIDLNARGVALTFLSFAYGEWLMSPDDQVADAICAYHL